MQGRYGSIIVYIRSLHQTPPPPHSFVFKIEIGKNAGCQFFSFFHNSFMRPFRVIGSLYYSIKCYIVQGLLKTGDSVYQSLLYGTQHLKFNVAMFRRYIRIYNRVTEI